MIPVEICVNSESEAAVFESVGAAWQAGASRIELCADMTNNGLTPSASHIEVARQAFRDRGGLLVMIRPRAGDFFYDEETIRRMIQQIIEAADAGADGVVFGAIDPDSGMIHKDYCHQLVDTAKDRGLETIVHRAFDVVSDWQQALDDLMALGVDRFLSSGIPWGQQGTALDGVKRLKQMLTYLQGRVELVVGGGVSAANAGAISQQLLTVNNGFSMHTYSAVLENDRVSQKKVEMFSQRVAGH